MTEQQNNASLENRINILHQDGRRWLILVQELDATETVLSGTGKSFTEWTTWRVEGNRQGSLEIIDDQGRKHTMQKTTVYTAVNPEREPVKSSTPKAVQSGKKIEDMTKAELRAYINSQK